jgi:hypothetical protein
MAITIVSGNLNTYGNNGNFETDPSTWGFSSTNPARHTISRSSEQVYQDNYSLKANILVDDGVVFLIAGALVLSGSTSKKYVAKARVRTPAANPAGTGATKLSLKNIIGAFPEYDLVDKTITEATDEWVELEYYFSPSFNGNFSVNLFLLSSATYGGESIPGGILYVDKFEVFEYVETDVESPFPIPDKIFFHKNFVVFSKSAASGWEAVNNLRLYADTRVEEDTDSDTYNSKLRLRLYPQTDGSVNFYVRQAFRENMNPANVMPPTLNHSEIIRLTDRSKYFKLFTGTIQDDEIEPIATDESLIYLVLWGGISKYHAPDINFFEDYLPTTKKFMTWAPKVKNIDRLQEDYLNFFIYAAGITTVKLQVVAYYDDTTTQTATTKTLSGVAYGLLVQVPAGPVNSGASAIDPSKNLIRYELSLLNQDDEVVSETRTYNVAITRHPLTRYFMFLNSLGAYEVLLLSGEMEETNAIGREVIQKFLPHTYAALDGELVSNTASIQVKRNYSTGYFKGNFSAEWREYMKDVMITPKIYDVTDGQRRRVVVLNDSMPGNTDRDYLRFARFDTEDTYIDESFTPTVI